MKTTTCRLHKWTLLCASFSIKLEEAREHITSDAHTNKKHEHTLIHSVYN